MCKNRPVVREHHLGYRQRSAILHARLATRPVDSGVGRPRLRDHVFLAATEQAGLPLAQDLVNTAVLKTSFRYSHRWVGPLLWPHATRCSKSFSMRSTRRTARISVTDSTADTRVRCSRSASRRTVSDPAAAEDPQAEHTVPEYARLWSHSAAGRWQSQ